VRETWVAKLKRTKKRVETKMNLRELQEINYKSTTYNMDYS